LKFTTVVGVKSPTVSQLHRTSTIHNTTDSKIFKWLLKSYFYNRSFDITA